MSSKPSNSPNGHRISALLAAFREALPPDRVSLADASVLLGDRTVGSILFLLAIPAVMPIPIGASLFFNLPVFIFAARLMLLGPDRALPDWLMHRSIARGTALAMIDGILPRLRGVEHLLRPRLSLLVSHRVLRGLGMVCFIMAIIASIPIPLLGWLPGFGLIAIALGLIEHDGVAVAIGLALGMTAAIASAVLMSGLFHAGSLLLTLPSLHLGP